MKFKINTPNGPYRYKFRPVYEGMKMIDKAISRENLLIFNNIAKENGLKFSLAYGTLLGALREGDFITHDEDIDLGILEEDRESFLSLLFRLRDEGFEVIRYDRRNSLCSIMRKGEYIDIYFFASIGKGIRQTLGHPIPEEYVTNLVPFEFLGEKFMIPRDSEDCLVFLYGQNWRTPIVAYDYDKSWIKKRIITLEWWFVYLVPDFIFNKLIKKRQRKKIERFNHRAQRLADYKGRQVIAPLSLD